MSSAKKALRLQMKNCLKLISEESKERQSQQIYEKLINLPVYQNSKRVAVYLNMADEVRTDKIVKNIFSTGKECFIPWYDGDQMKMLRLDSLQDLDSLPRTKWNIRQPGDPESREDALLKGLDLVLVPGLAFTLSGGRLGRGKGYYDVFLSSLKTRGDALGRPCATVALAFSQQLVDHLPVDLHDFTLDSVLCPP